MCGACALDVKAWKTEAFARKMALYRSSMEWDTLGWFLTSSDVSHDPNQRDGAFNVMQLHNAQFVELSGNQAPLYVSFNPDGGARGELALRVFESSLEQHGDTTHPKMVSQSFAVRASPWESAVVSWTNRELMQAQTDAAAGGAAAGGAAAAEEKGAALATSSVTRRMSEIRAALGVLDARVAQLRAFVARVERGEMRGEDALSLVRLAASICHRLPVLDTRDFRAELQAEYTDAMLITYLATVTKSQQAVSAVLDKSERAFGERGSALGAMGFGGLSAQDGSSAM